MATKEDANKVPVNQMASAFDRQVGGRHYKEMAIQPIEFILANHMGFAEGTVIKYVSRWRAKGGIDDLRKARHVLDMLIESEESGTQPCTISPTERINAAASEPLVPADEGVREARDWAEPYLLAKAAMKELEKAGQLNDIVNLRAAAAKVMLLMEEVRSGR